MKQLVWVMVVGCLFVVPGLAQAQVDKNSDPSKSAHINTLSDSSIMKLFSGEGFPILRDESDARNRFSFAIDINGKINLIANLTSRACLYVGYRVEHGQTDFQPASPAFFAAQPNKNALYHGPFFDLKLRW